MAKLFAKQVPNNAHPLVKLLFNEMDLQGVTMVALAKKSGVHRHTIDGWQNNVQPDLNLLEACLNTLKIRIVAERFN